MHSPILPFALGFAALVTLPSQPQRGQEPKAAIDRLEVPRIKVAPVLGGKLPDRRMPKLPARELLRAPVPPQHFRASPDPVVARAGRLTLIPHNNEVVGEPIPPPADPAAWGDDFEERPAPAQPEVRFAKENLDDWIFGNMDTEALRREWLGSVLDERIAALVESRGLTEAQSAKLRLAGYGDIRRFFAGVERERRQFELNRADLGWALRQLEDTDGLAKEFRRGPFGIGSLFEKTLAQMSEGRR